MYGFEGECLYGKFIAGRNKDDFSPALTAPHLHGYICPQNTGHANIQQGDIKIAFLFYIIQQFKGIVILKSNCFRNSSLS